MNKTTTEYKDSVIAYGRNLSDSKLISMLKASQSGVIPVHAGLVLMSWLVNEGRMEPVSSMLEMFRSASIEDARLDEFECKFLWRIGSNVQALKLARVSRHKWSKNSLSKLVVSMQNAMCADPEGIRSRHSQDLLLELQEFASKNAYKALDAFIEEMVSKEYLTDEVLILFFEWLHLHNREETVVSIMKLVGSKHVDSPEFDEFLAHMAWGDGRWERALSYAELALNRWGSDKLEALVCAMRQKLGAETIDLKQLRIKHVKITRDFSAEYVF